MQAPHLVIIGGAAGGASAAARARHHSRETRITLIEKEAGFPLCPSSPHSAGLLRLDLRTRTEAFRLDPSRREIEIRHLPSGRPETLSYDVLILATGALPLHPDLPGFDDPRVLPFRRPADLERLVSLAPPSTPLAVVGAGFTGLELAGQLRLRGHPVALVERRPHILPALDPEMTAPLVRGIAARGIDLHLDDPPRSITPAPSGLTLHLLSGRSLDAGLVILALGSRPENTLARQAGLALGIRGHIQVSPFQQTTAPAVYAVGDVCETLDHVFGQPLASTLAGPARRQAVTAVDHFFLGDRALPYPAALGTAIVRVFDLSAGLTGATEARLQAAKRPYRTLSVSDPSTESTLKLLWCPSSRRLLGAQIVGNGHVDKHLDTLATALRGHLTIDDLARLELADFPPSNHLSNLIHFAAVSALDRFPSAPA